MAPAISELPTYDELFAPDFGAEVPAQAGELFAREPRGLMRLEDGSVVACGNADLISLLPNQAFGNVPAGVIAGDDEGFLPLLYNHVFTMNPPMHGPHRTAFSKPFTAGAVKNLMSIGTQVVTEIVAESLEREVVDLSADIAVQTTTRFWGRLLNMTQEEEQIVSEIVAGDFSLNFLFARTEEQDALNRNANVTYLETVRAAVMRSLKSGDNELVNTMAADLDAIDGERVEDVGLLLGASLADGYHTLAGALTNTCYALISRPDELERVRSDQSLVKNAFNEGIRLDPPLISTFRYTIADAELSGTQVPEGTLIFLMWMFGNRDPEAFDAPDQYVLSRDASRAQAFGGGIHNCPGRNVSRMLGHTLLQAVTAPKIHVEPLRDDPEWVTGSLLHEIDGGYPVALKAS